jgi:hypothetical protein
MPGPVYLSSMSLDANSGEAVRVAAERQTGPGSLSDSVPLDGYVSANATEGVAG